MEDIMMKLEDIYYTVYDYTVENPNVLIIAGAILVAFIIGAIGDRKFKKKRLRRLEEQMISEHIGKRVDRPEPVKMIRKEKETNKIEKEDDVKVKKDDKPSQLNTQKDKEKITKKEEKDEENEIWKL